MRFSLNNKLTDYTYTLQQFPENYLEYGYNNRKLDRPVGLDYERIITNSTQRTNFRCGTTRPRSKWVRAGPYG